MDKIDFAQYAEEVAKALLGEPNGKLSKPGELRFGTNGSLVVKTSGAEAGTFFDHEESVGGGVLKLISHKRGGDEREAMAWLSETFGLASRPSVHQIAGKPVVAVYPYHDESGATHFEVVRLAPKDFRQRRSETNWGVKGCRKIPYRLPALLEALASERPVFIVEGEKDVDRLARLGITATCNAGGANKWTAEHAAFLQGADVVILPDNDEAGRDHGEAVARSLAGVACRIRVLNLPNLARKGDVSDWLDAAGTVEALFALVADAPDWRRSSALGLTWLGEEDRLPPRKWLARGLLGENEMSVVFAPSSGGKSFIALDMGARIAAGLDWFGHRVTRSAVLYIAGEGSTGFRQRMTAWRRQHGISDIPFVMLPRALDLYSREAPAIETIQEAMAEIAERAGMPVRLIVLDTLSRMMHGGVDSDPKDMKLFLEHVEELRHATGAHIMIIHHTGKETDRGMRGSSMLRDFADTVLEIKPPVEDGPHRIVVEKQKDGEEGRNYRARISQSVVGTDEDGEDITSCVVEHLDASETPGTEKSQKRLSDREEVAKRVLAELLLDDSVTSVTSALPPNVTRGVTVERWRQACADRFAMESDAAFRKAWERLKTKLLRLGVIGIAEGLAWLA